MQNSVYSGWNLWTKKTAGTFRIPTARTRANSVHDHIANELETRTRGLKNVRFSRTSGRALLHIGNSLVIEIHKLDDDLVAMRNQTAFAGMLDSQQLSNGLGHVQVLTLGYQHDELGEHLRKALVVCVLDGHMKWDIDLNEQVGSTSITHPKKSGTTTRTKKRRVTPKPGATPMKKPGDGENES
ncbi:hypothetical protein HJC10_09435 [Corallococcus exiguus]|nr:hypothetical protein [Corallococcus exiguus]